LVQREQLTCSFSFPFTSRRNRTRRCDQLLTTDSRSSGASSSDKIDIFSHSGPGSSKIHVPDPSNERRARRTALIPRLIYETPFHFVARALPRYDRCGGRNRNGFTFAHSGATL